MLSPGYGFVIIMTSILAFLLAVNYGFLSPQEATYVALGVGVVTTLIIISMFPELRGVIAGAAIAIILWAILLYVINYIDSDYGLVF